VNALRDPSAPGDGHEHGDDPEETKRVIEAITACLGV
jgi:hypothetical protein